MVSSFMNEGSPPKRGKHGGHGGSWMEFPDFSNRQLARAVGVHERAAHYWELKEQIPTSTPELAITDRDRFAPHGVIVFASPTPGARLALSTV
jgi:hypothetical protein